MIIQHSWNLTPTEAVALQKELRSQIVLQTLPSNIELIAGADVSFNKYSEIIFAGIVVLRLSDLSVVAKAGVQTTTKFPYVSGLLSFREAPAVLEAWEKLAVRPDVLVLDGQGIAHPRRVGIASHVGLMLSLPTIGCAKTLLIGKYEELPEKSGSRSQLIYKDEIIGTALRTKNRVQPVFVSPGYLSDVESSADLLLRCVEGYAQGKSKYRIPAPTRLAHLFVNALRRGEEWLPKQ